ncbi:hypothetical protein O6H91_08G103700 [Diphasiastrum complanatum]|uniref:Uncharacterized protein n=1 Tax=Diphasiastrum complanatum TaxID=34168 RepID=A0ACC2D1G2_DIPCM|nr:hypothetical protein O6H91_08G103700 [Diphasiastrum complanatum]
MREMAQAVLPVACAQLRSLQSLARPQQPSLTPLCTTLKFHFHSHNVVLQLTQQQQRCRQDEGLRCESSIHVSGFSEVGNDVEDFDVCCSGAFMVPMMKREYGAFGGATLEKSKLELSQPTSKVAPQTEDGGGGGDIGKKINHGGGDGGDDGGDDDDYFGEADDGDEGDDEGFFNRKVAIPEVFDRKIVEAVLQEWYRTMTDLPAGIRQAVQMGLISSAQMVKFLSINARPTLARAVSRAIPAPISRAFIGRMIADPAFLYKVLLEQIATIGYGTWREFQHRGERIRKEWDLAAINVMTLAACNLAIVCSLAPSRSYATVFKYDLQNALQKLPNNVFDRSYPLREFDMKKRVYGFFYKAAELSLVGMVIGTAGAGLSEFHTALNKQDAGMEMSSGKLTKIQTSALGYGAFLGISGNLRYQLVYGAERLMREHFNHMGFLIICSSALRLPILRRANSQRTKGMQNTKKCVFAQGVGRPNHEEVVPSGPGSRPHRWGALPPNPPAGGLPPPEPPKTCCSVLSRNCNLAIS